MKDQSVNRQCRNCGAQTVKRHGARSAERYCSPACRIAHAEKIKGK